MLGSLSSQRHEVQACMQSALDVYRIGVTLSVSAQSQEKKMYYSFDTTDTQTDFFAATVIQC